MLDYLALGSFRFSSSVAVVLLTLDYHRVQTMFELFQLGFRLN